MHVIGENENNHEEARLSMKTTPFAFICSALIVGILGSEQNVTIAFWSSVSILLLVLGFILHLFRPKENLHYFIYFLFLFAQLGFLNSHIQKTKNTSFTSPQNYTSQCQIIEISSNGKKWNKGIALVKEYKKNTENISNEINEKILFYTDSFSSKNLKEGDLIELKSQIQPILNKGNPGEFNAVSFWKNKGIRALTFFTNLDFNILSRTKSNLKQDIKTNVLGEFQKWLPKKHLGMSNALFLGDKSFLNQETRNAFSAAGAMHLLAISGLHIGLFVWIIFSLLRLAPRLFTRRIALLVSLIFVWSYAFLIEFPPSVLRSVLMFSILSIGYSFKGSKNQLNILFFSASTLLLYNPMYLLDIGFQLSYSALIGITLCYKPLVDSMKLNNRFIKYTWNISALCLSAQLFTFPLCLFYFHQFPNYFLITNIGVALFSGYVIGLGLLFLLTSKMSIIASIIGILFSFSLTTLTLFVKKIESLPASVSRGFELNIYDLIYLIALCIGLYWFLLKKRKPLSGGVILLIIAFSISAKRFQQITHKHFVLFNSNKFSCAYYDSKNIYFFHDNLKKNKITALLRDYKSVFPGNIIISNIGKNNYELRSKTHSIVFNKNNKKMNLAIDNQDYEIIYRQYNQPMKRVKTIGMPWVENTNIRLNKAYFFDF